MSISIPASSSILPPGMPCWVELATVDETAAGNFYSRLFGWTYRALRDPTTSTGRYLIASLGAAEVGGLYQAEPGQGSRWTINIAVRNTARVAEWVEHLGGAVTLGPVAVPGRGSIVRALDPTGVPVVFWQVPENWDFASGVPHTFSRADFNTHDGEAADAFFQRLFNYTTAHVGDDWDHVQWNLDHEPVLYRHVMGPEYLPDTPAHWLIHFEVDPARGTDATARNALMLGGDVVVEPFDSPWGRIAVLSDPTGALFSIVDISCAPDDWGRAEVDDPYDD